MFEIKRNKNQTKIDPFKNVKYCNKGVFTKLGIKLANASFYHGTNVIIGFTQGTLKNTINKPKKSPRKKKSDERWWFGSLKSY
jgi:hypothetical protein